MSFHSPEYTILEGETVPGATIIWVNEDGGIVLYSKGIELNELSRKLQENGIKPLDSIIIGGYPTTSHTSIVNIMGQLGEGGYSNLQVKVITTAGETP